MKKFLCIILLLSLILSGCNNPSNSENNSTSSNNTKTNFESMSAKEKEQLYENSDSLASNVSTDFVNNMNDFSLDLFRELQKEDTDKTIFISPFSISTALTMLYNGADNNTKDEMAKAMYLEDLSLEDINEYSKSLLESLMKADEQVTLNINNSTWIHQNFEPKGQYIDNMQDYFFSEVITKDFANPNTVDDINNWIEQSTEGLIDKLIDEIDDDVIMYLINTIYFNGDWTYAFEEHGTFDDNFYGLNTTSVVPYMIQTNDFNYLSNDAIEGIELPYGRERISFYAFLPTDDTTSLDELIENLNNTTLNNYFDEFNKESVYVKIPKFELEYGIKELQDSLQSLGMVDVFTEGKADLSGIGDNIYASRVLHKAVIQLDETGTEAAAATAVEIRLESAEVEPIEEFCADRPFLFIIRDNITNSILFMGKVTDL